MKLLFDENLSPALASAFLADHPGSTRVHLAGLGSATDDRVWLYARENGFTIVTKDADFHERSLIEGYPPKVIWMRRGNLSSAQIEAAPREYRQAIDRLDQEPELATLIV